MTTSLSVAARNLVAQDTDLLALGLVGGDTGASPLWPVWAWADTPQRRIENSQKCAIVFTEGSPWTSRNEHNTLYFPTLVVDIWADPTRNTDKSVKRYDADDKIKSVARVINRLFHTVNKSVPTGSPAWMGTPGLPRIWGTATEIQDRAGLLIVSSLHASGPNFSDMASNDGGRMGRFIYNIETP